MEDDLPIQPSLTTRIAWLDPPDMVELETRVIAGNWRGVARAYTSPDKLRRAAKSVQEWCHQPEGQAEINAGTDNGTGWMRLRFYPVDLAGHVVCHVDLAAEEIGRRPDSVRRLSLEMRSEVGLIERYARHLETIAESLGEEAVLLGLHE